MKRSIVTTSDGSKTIYIEEVNERYHSQHGALQEAQHVFVEYGLNLFKEKKKVVVFELGFGTGLNSILAYRWANDNSMNVEYYGVEAFPVEIELISQLEYASFLSEQESIVWKKMHEKDWDEEIIMDKLFLFKKLHNKIEELPLQPDVYDVIFFDAFGPRVDGHLWEPLILKKMYDSLHENGKLVTYCAQGQFKRNLKSVGFEVKCYPGPPGKREMTVAEKI